MTNLIGVFILSIFLSGCMITAASGTRTEYEDKMQVIEKDYREKKITKDEYILLKSRASQHGDVAQRDGSMSPSQKTALEN
ncbi:MAG: hypothetical protein HQL28_03820 [Candidatus Omnitrophica bacterium]|nr:hypothetical protein [Candidatus Omnitrophota bacterium]